MLPVTESRRTVDLFIIELQILLKVIVWNTNLVLDSDIMIYRDNQDKHHPTPFYDESSCSFSWVTDFLISDAVELFSSKQTTLRRIKEAADGLVREKNQCPG